MKKWFYFLLFVIIVILVVIAIVISYHMGSLGNLLLSKLSELLFN
jgi:hypothetical protein